MIKGYFGVPGSGKSTVLVKEYLKNKKKYDHIYTINIDIDGVKRITKEDFEKYKFYNTLILWDEITLDYDNRAFKEFSKQARDSFLLHRHTNLDIIWCTQNYNKVDLKVQDLTIELWYISKSVIPLAQNFTVAKRIYRTININENTSELTLGYRFCRGLEKFFASNVNLIYRPRYYKYFDTNEELTLKWREEYESRE